MIPSPFSPRQAAEYLQRGWFVIPVPRGSKAPTLPGWQNLRLTLEDLPRFFNDGQNIGVLLGEPSGWLCDVDLDHFQALQVAEYFLPQTQAIFGRPSKPRSHWLYICSNAKTTRFEYDSVIAEIRSTGAQTVFPGSIHPSGEEIRWDVEGEPAHVDFATLKRCVAKLAACVLLAQHYPAKGNRQFASMALAGWFLRNNWSREETADFIEGLCALAGDEETRQRVAQIRNTAQKIEADLPATGFPTLKEYYPEEVLRKVAEWLELRTERQETTRFIVFDKFHPRPFSQVLMAKYQFWWPNKKEPLLWFDPESGLWREDGEELIVHELRTAVEQLPDVQKRRYVIEEIVADIKGCSWREKPLPEPPVHLIPLVNGVFDLETGKLRPYRAEDFFTFKLPWRYNPEAQSKLIVPLVESFLPEEQTITLYELIAYCLWRGYPYQKLFLLYGRGSNGKSLFARILETLLGKENVSHVPLSELQNGRFSGAQLYKKLANVTGELEYSEIQNTRLLKQLTGEDTVEADRKYRETIKFRNYAKLIFLTNEVPRSADTTEAFYRRLFLIEFPKRFKENPELEVRVASACAEEYEALLYKVLQVLQDLRKRNFIFTHHKPVDEVRELYLRLSSPLHTFIEEHCAITYSGDDYIYKYEFRERFSQWLCEKGHAVYSDSRLKREMQALGLDEARKGKENWWAWVGLRWKNNFQHFQNFQGFKTNPISQKNCFESVEDLEVLEESASHAASDDFVTLGETVTEGGSVTGKRDSVTNGRDTLPEEEDPFVLHVTELDRTLGPDEARRVLVEYCRKAFVPLFEACDTIAQPVRQLEDFAQRVKAHCDRLKRCSVCSHPERREIEAALVSGESLRKIAERFGVGRMALQRHKASHPLLRTVTITLSRRDSRGVTDDIKMSSVTGRRDSVTDKRNGGTGSVTDTGVTGKLDAIKTPREGERGGATLKTETHQALCFGCGKTTTFYPTDETMDVFRRWKCSECGWKVWRREEGAYPNGTLEAIVRAFRGSVVHHTPSGKEESPWPPEDFVPETPSRDNHRRKVLRS